MDIGHEAQVCKTLLYPIHGTLPLFKRIRAVDVSKHYD